MPAEVDQADPVGSAKIDTALSPADVLKHAQKQLDLGHRDIAPVRALLIGLTYLCLSIVNYVGFEGDVGLTLGVMAAAVGLVFCSLFVFYRRVDINPGYVNAITFFELAFLQADGMAFLVLTQDIMNSYGVFVMIVGAGIFMTRLGWWLAIISLLLISWLTTLYLADVAFDLVRESLFVVASLGGSLLYFALRWRGALRLSRIELQKNAYLNQLEQALREIDTLSGLLPICARCKNIRDESGQWQQIEAYVSDHSRANFSHGICPDCKSEIYSEFDVAEN